MRLTYRVLYNFNKVSKPGSYIEADGTINVWKKDPLFIFDDTLIHQSFNEEDNSRYCIYRYCSAKLLAFSNCFFIECCRFLIKKYAGNFLQKLEDDITTIS